MNAHFHPGVGRDIDRLRGGTPRLRLRGAFSLVGMLITMVCIVVLFAIGMTALNKAFTGEGSQLEGTVRSFEDKTRLRSLFLSLQASAPDFDGRFLTPAALAGSADVTQNTTANFYSAMVMHNQIPPEQLISGNEYNPWVEIDHDYDHTAYRPADGIFWDPSFSADLATLSNVSFAHMPLFGERFDRHWAPSMSSTTPILGNRGPRNGEPNPESYTYGRDGQWRGHVVFGDGSVDFIETFTPSGITFERNGQRYQDNIFALEDGEAGRDAILSFTKTMDPDGPELQHD